jgi:hypothetical protein
MVRATLFLLSLTLLAGVARADSLYVRLVGRCDFHGDAAGVAVSGDYVCVANYDTFRVISVADRAHPVVVGHKDSLGGARGVDVSGIYAYVADYNDSSLRVFSIADPANPVEVGRCHTPYAAGCVAVSGDYAYVGDDRGLRVISVADPTHPMVVGQCGTYRPYCLAVRDCYVFAAEVTGGTLRIISVADPAHPIEVGCYYASLGIQAVAVDEKYVYVASNDSFFRVISVADPSQPIEVGSCRFTVSSGYPAAPQALEVIRGYAFVATFYSGLRVISVADPAHPEEVGSYASGQSWSMDADADYVYWGASGSVRILQFYQLGDIDIDNDSLDVLADTLRLRRWITTPSSSFRRSDEVAIGGISSERPLDSHRYLGVTEGTGAQFECAYGEFILANTSASYNPDSIDGPSVSPVDSLRCTGSLTGPGGTIDSIVIPNLPTSFAQGQTLVCTLAVYVPVGLRDGDYAGSILISCVDTADLQVYENCYVFLRKLGDLDVDNDSLDVVSDTIRARPRLVSSGPPPVYTGYALGEFLLANTSESYNPDTADGPSHSTVRSLRFTGALAGLGGTIDSILIPNLPESLAVGQTFVCTLAVYVPPELPDGDYSGPIVITRSDSLEPVLAETVYALVTKLGDLDVDNDALDVVHDTMNVSVQPISLPSGKARFMLVNTSSSYNPDAADGPSRSPLREVKVEAKVEGRNGSTDSVYVLNLPESLAVGQAVECTLALVLPVGATPDGYSGWITISAVDTLGYQVRDSFLLTVRGPQPRQNLDSLRVAPIPFKPNQNPEHDAIHFQGLTVGARVVVYDASGQSVWSATENGDGHLKWDAKVASGIYVYLVVAKDGQSRVGKLSVIR